MIKKIKELETKLQEATERERELRAKLDKYENDNDNYGGRMNISRMKRRITIKGKRGWLVHYQICFRTKNQNEEWGEKQWATHDYPLITGKKKDLKDINEERIKYLIKQHWERKNKTGNEYIEVLEIQILGWDEFLDKNLSHIQVER